MNLMRTERDPSFENANEVSGRAIRPANAFDRRASEGGRQRAKVEDLLRTPLAFVTSAFSHRFKNPRNERFSQIAGQEKINSFEFNIVRSKKCKSLNSGHSEKLIRKSN